MAPSRLHWMNIEKSIAVKVELQSEIKMNLQKGMVYTTDRNYDFMCHERAEYHSSGIRHCDAKPLHNMIMRMQDDSLEMGIFLDEDINGLAEIQSI